MGEVHLGSLRRVTPLSRSFGLDRGSAIDRVYVEDFLRRHGNYAGYATGDIRGAVLEVGDDRYTREFGGWRGDGATGPVRSLDVLHASRENPQATVVGDLVTGEGIPSGAYDCVICTQTLHVVYEVGAVVATLHRALRPGGVVLVTAAGISPACRPDADNWGDWWRFTSRSARRLFEEHFPAAAVEVEAYGNVLAATAFLYGMSAEELTRDELEARDPDYEMLVAVRARKEA